MAFCSSYITSRGGITLDAAQRTEELVRQALSTRLPAVIKFQLLDR